MTRSNRRATRTVSIHIRDRRVRVILRSLLLAGGTALSACSGANTPPQGESTGATTQAVTPPPHSAKWLIVLCTPSDYPTPPPGDTQAFFTDLFATGHTGAAGSGGIFDYFRDQSYGNLDMTGTVVTAWTQPDTLSNLVKLDQGGLTSKCINSYLNTQSPSYPDQFFDFAAVIHRVDSPQLLYCLQENTVTIGTGTHARTLAVPCADTFSAPTAIEHEMGHGLSLGHSYGDNAAAVYQDQYDIMSAMNVYGFTGNYCLNPGGCYTGPGLNMWNKYRLGWVGLGSPGGPVVNGGGQTPAWPNGFNNYTGTFTIAARNHPEYSGSRTPLWLYVPSHADSGYEVEYVTPDGWEQGIGVPSLTIRRIYNGNDTPYRLYEQGGVQTDFAHPFNEGSVSIALKSINAPQPTANVRVSYGPGYQWTPQPWLTYGFNGTCGGNFVADVTGDGKADLVGLGCGYIGVEPSTGTSFGPYATWWNATFDGSYGNFVADVTGDGKADLVGMGPGYVGVVPSTGTSFGTYGQWSSTDLFGYALMVGDVTGDGEADIVAFHPYSGSGSSDSISVLASTGSSFAAPVLWYQGPVNTTIDRTHGMFLNDVDGDRKADIVALGANGTTVLLSTGSGFGAPQQWVAGPFNGAQGNFVVDVTGDGRADLLGVGAGYIGVGVSTAGGPSSYSPIFAYETWSLQNFTSDLVTRAADVNGDGMADLIAFDNSQVLVLPTVRAP